MDLEDKIMRYFASFNNQVLGEKMNGWSGGGGESLEGGEI